MKLTALGVWGGFPYQEAGTTSYLLSRISGFILMIGAGRRAGLCRGGGVAFGPVCAPVWLGDAGHPVAGLSLAATCAAIGRQLAGDHAAGNRWCMAVYSYPEPAVGGSGTCGVAGG